MAVEIRVPQLGESVSEATVAKWFKKVGEAIAADEPLVELETDKVTVEVPAPSAGVLTAISAATGSEVSVGAVLGTVDPKGTASAPSKTPAKSSASNGSQQSPAPAVSKVTPPTASAKTSPSSTTIAPSVRRIADENNLDPASIPPTGPKGNITKGDALAQVASKGAGSAPISSRETRPSQPLAPRADHPQEERVRMSKLRQKIAQRLKEAQNTAAILTTFNEVDMTAVMALRNQFKDNFEKKHGVKLGFMSFFVKAAITVLKELPSVNAEIHGDEIIYKNYYDIGVAVSTPQGLVVPVLRSADQLSFAAIEGAINDLGKRARDGQLSIPELTGGTFTITNGGVFGSLMSTPILNPPQSGILGMHKIQNRPVAIEDKIEIRPMMYLALSYDHRIIDGREAVTFLVRIKELVENPQRLLLDI